jgi:hypothetical protein
MKRKQMIKYKNMDILIKKANKKIKVIIKKELTDPICMRASIGGLNDHYYLVYRGDNLDNIEEMLSDVLTAFKMAKKQILDSNSNLN